MTSRFGRLRWFAGLYLLSIVAFALATFLIHALLWLIA
jgi:hypothetical protein